MVSLDEWKNERGQGKKFVNFCFTFTLLVLVELLINHSVKNNNEKRKAVNVKFG